MWLFMYDSLITLGNCDYTFNFVQLLEEIIMPHFFLFFAWMFLFVLFGYYSVPSNKIVNPSGCCSFPHGHTCSSICSFVWLFPCRGSSWHPALHPSPWGLHPGLSTLFLWAFLFFSLTGSLGIFRSGVYSFIKSSYPLCSVLFFENVSISGARRPPLNPWWFLFLSN